jgi:hypothetical protein
MSVQCEGDVWVMEQIGEKQDFESALSRLGFRHEDFDLCVRRPKASGASAAWVMHYAVQVRHAASGRRNIYWGGPKEQWVAQFAADLIQGMYGPPPLVRAPRRRMALVRSLDAV